MAEKSYRIRTQVNGGDNVLNVSLKQGIKTLNILSLEIDPTDAYDIQTSDYGVIVGRVLANDAFGVPNVKVSVFIPISSEDEGNYIISNEYPYKTPQSKGINGVKYNLLYQKAGTFPGKRMVLDNDGCIEVFDKYWKYTTTTNQSGDYMLFGIPTGSTQVHYDCDLSDIGILSQHPYDFISKGYNANLFKSKTEFLDTEIGRAVHIISQDKTVYVYPFWGDKDGNKIGITRSDIDINYKFEPSCVFLGSVITDQEGSCIGVNGEPNGANGRFDSLATSPGNIEVIRKTLDGGVEELKDNVVGVIDGNGVWCYQIPMNLDRIGTDEEGNMIAVNDPERGIPTRARVRFRISLTNADSPSKSEYTAKMLVPCNPKLESQKVDGVKIKNAYFNSLMEMTPVPEGFHADYYNGAFSLPSDYTSIYEFGDKTPESSFRDLYWGKVYSVKQYYPRFQYENDIKSVLPYNDDTDLSENGEYWLIRFDDDDDGPAKEKKEMYNFEGYPPSCAFKQSCISSIDVINGMNTFPYTTLYMSTESSFGFNDKKVPYWFYYHMTDAGGEESLNQKGLKFCFENDWINGCLYFPRIIIRKVQDGTTDYFGMKCDASQYNAEWLNYYWNVYISGRHHWHWNGKSFKVVKPDLGAIGQSNDSDCDYESFYPHNESVFSRVRLTVGIVTKKKTMRGADVYYYRCGFMQSIEDINENITNESNDVYVSGYGGDSTPMYTYLNSTESIGYGLLRDNNNLAQQTILTYSRLYSTDIILLGNMEDIYDHLPKLYESLPDTTAKFPPVAPPFGLSESGMSKHGYMKQIENSAEDGDEDVIDIYGNVEDITETTHNGYNETYSERLYEVVKRVNGLKSEYERLTESSKSEYQPYERMLVRLSRRYSLFFGLRFWQVDNTTSFDIPTFVNSSRLCELDIHNDSAFKFSDGNGDIVPVNGMIDLYDISTNENRSAFATMNYDIEKYIINRIGNRQYIPTQLAINGFEGRLSEYIDKNYFGYRGNTSQSKNGPYDIYNPNYPRYAIDDEDPAYTQFRFKSSNNGNGPYVQIEFYPKVDYYRSIYGDGIVTSVNISDIPLTGLLYYYSEPTKNSVQVTFGEGNNAETVTLNYKERHAYVNKKITKVNFLGGPGYLYVYSRWKWPNSGKALWYKHYCHGPLYTPENSFYFYFGLRNGFSALDALKDRYVGKVSDDAGVDAAMVGVSQVKNAFECEGDIALYQCRINTGEAKLSIVWKIKVGDNIVKEGEISTREDCIVSGLTSGNYIFEATDSDGIFYSSKFYIEEQQVNVDYDAYYETDSNMPMMYITMVDNSPIRFNSYPIQTPGVGWQMYQEFMFITDDEEYYYYTKLSADTPFSVSYGDVTGDYLTNVTFTFKQHTKSVNIIITRTNESGDNTCINNHINVTFRDLPGNDIRLNNVPVKYLMDWTSYQAQDFSGPDSDYSYKYFNIFDSIHALDLTSGNARGFKFEQFYEDEETELAYTSLMFNAVCGNSNMNMYSGYKDSGFNMISIAPNFNSPILENHYLKPVEAWGKNLASAYTETESGMTVFFNESTIGNKDVPHIVGSNYPRNYDSKTLLLSGGDDSEYVNNNAFYENPNYETYSFGINLFALESKTSPEYDQPGPNIRPSGFTETSTTEKIEIGNVENYYGVRTVDKRLDYQFSMTTPLILPSGYDNFPNLEPSGFTEASVYIDLYGGIRLNYSGDTKEITCYDFVENHKDTLSPSIVPSSDYESYWIERSDNDNNACIITYKHSTIYGIFSGNTVMAFDVSSYSGGDKRYVARFEESIGMAGPMNPDEAIRWGESAGGLYTSYLFTSASTLTIPYNSPLDIMGEPTFISTNDEDYLRKLNTPTRTHNIEIPVGSTYLIVSKSSYTEQETTIDILEGMPCLQGKPQKDAIKGNDEAKLYSISANEYYINSQENELANEVSLEENKICVWYDNINEEDELADVDHVVYSASTICAGTEKFKADFTSCSPLFTNGVAEEGDTESVITSYKSGVSVVSHGVDSYDLIYKVDMSGQPSPGPVTGSTSGDSGTTVEAFASFSGSSLEVTLEPDSAWYGETYTDINTQESNNGLYPEWAGMSDWKSALENKPELALCVCYPPVTLSGNTFNLYSAYTLTAEFRNGVSYSGNTCISAVSGDTPLSDSKAGENVRFRAEGLDKLVLSGDTFMIIPTRKVYTTPDSPTLLKQGVVCNMGYVYFAGSIFVKKYMRDGWLNVDLRLNTPLNDANSATILKGISDNTATCMWHTIGLVDECGTTQNVGTLSYDNSTWTFNLRLDDMSTDAVTIYFSILNGLRYRVDIVGLASY